MLCFLSVMLVIAGQMEGKWFEYQEMQMRSGETARPVVGWQMVESLETCPKTPEFVSHATCRSKTNCLRKIIQKVLD